MINAENTAFVRFTKTTKFVKDYNIYIENCIKHQLLKRHEYKTIKLPKSQQTDVLKAKEHFLLSSLYLSYLTAQDLKHHTITS